MENEILDYKKLKFLLKENEELIFNDYNDILNIKFENKKSKQNFEKIIKFLTKIPKKNYYFILEKIKKSNSPHIIEFYEKEYKNILEENIKTTMKITKNFDKNLFLYFKKCILLFLEEKGKIIFLENLKMFYEIILKLYILTDKFTKNIYFINFFVEINKNKELNKILKIFLEKIFSENLNELEYNNQEDDFELIDFNFKNIKKEEIDLENDFEKISFIKTVNITLNELINIIPIKQNERQEYFKLEENCGICIMSEIKTQDELYLLNLVDKFYNKINIKKQDKKELYKEKIIFVYSIEELKSSILIQNAVLKNLPVIFLIENKKINSSEMKKFRRIKNKLFKKYKIIVDFIKISTFNNELEHPKIEKYKIDIIYY